MQTSYRVDIAAAGGAAPSDGFVDNTRVEIYRQGGSSPTTLDQSLAKERANARFDFLRQQLQRETNIYIDSIVATGANAVTAPSKFSFTAVVEHGEETLSTVDETAPANRLSGIDALKRYIARALVLSQTLVREVYDPTQSSGQGNPPAAARVGIRNISVEVGAVSADLTTATSLVTVTKLP